MRWRTCQSMVRHGCTTGYDTATLSIGKQGQMRTTRNTAHLFLGVALGVLASSPCIAESFAIFDDHEKLQDKVILSVGNVSDLSFPSITSTDPLAMNGKPSAHKIGQYCFLSDEPMNGNAYILLADKFSNVSIASLSTSISAVAVKIKSVTLIDCGQLQRAEHKRLLAMSRILSDSLSCSSSGTKI